LNAMRTLALQRANPYLREWYWRYHDPGGPQFLYAAPPPHTVAQLHDAGFAVLDVRGSSGERRPARVRRREQHVYFVAKQALGSFDVSSGALALNDVPWGQVDSSAIGPRFCWRFSHTGDGPPRSRITSHYRVDRGAGDDHGEAYYSGGNYVDYEEESRGQRTE